MTRLFPREPTPTMLEAATTAHDNYVKRPKHSGLVTPKTPDFWYQLAWTAMWDAAPCVAPDGLTERLERVAEWYESGPSYTVEFEAGRQRIAADIRAILAENDCLSKAVVSGILPELLTDDENTALVDFIRMLRAQPK